MRRALPAALLSLLCLSLPVQADARPVSATLYPGGALVLEEESAVPDSGRIVLHLPAEADPASLNLSLSQGCVMGRTMKLLPGKASPAVEASQRELTALRDSMSVKYAELASLAALREFWTQPPYMLNAPTVELLNELMDKLATDAEDKLAALIAREGALRADLRVMEAQAAALEADISALGKENKTVRECVLEVKDTGNTPVTVRYSYWLNNASWRPQYRVKADSDSGRIDIRMDAVITQNSGEDWHDVELTLASSDRLNDVTPPAIGNWVINDTIGSNTMLRAVRSTAADFAMGAAKAALPATSQDDAGLTWALGSLDVPAATSVTRLVSLHELESSFSRLARPRLSRDVWMCATLTPEELASDKLPLLPSGQASFLVNGRETARGSFRFGPGSKEIFFGIDGLMSATRQELALEPDTKKESAAADIRQWYWKTVIHNGHDKAVSLRVEEAAPIARTAHTAIEVETIPPAILHADTARYEWELQLPPHAKQDIVYRVISSTPLLEEYKKTPHPEHP